MFHEYVIAILLMAFHGFAMWAVRKYKLEERWGFATFAIFIMWKTQKGKRFIERLGRRRLKVGEAQAVEGPAAWAVAEQPARSRDGIVLPRLPKIGGSDASEILYEGREPKKPVVAATVDIDGSSKGNGEKLAPKAAGIGEETDTDPSPDPNLGTAPRRAWFRIGDLAVGFFIVFMAFMVGLLLWEATIVGLVPDSAAPSPQMALGIPGLNPIIPLGYGILGLAVAIIVHEFAHGVLARAEGMRVKSLGLLFFVVPMGAFVEPDEEEMKKAPRRKRMRIYAAGPASNFLCALICLLLFVFVFMGPVEPRERGAAVINVGFDSPALHGGLQVWELVTHVGGVRIDSAELLFSSSAIEPFAGTEVEVKGLYRGSPTSHQKVLAGVALINLADGLPAKAAGLKVGMVLYSLTLPSGNEAIIVHQQSLGNILGGLNAGEKVSLKVFQRDESSGKYSLTEFSNISLYDKGKYYKSVAPSLWKAEYDGKGFLGITSSYMGILAANPEDLVAPMKAPYGGVGDAGDLVIANFRLITYPLVGLSPMDAPLTDLYTVKGPLGALPPSVFWTLANSIYWIFWLNVMVGLTNVLPLKIVDGGHFFRDAFSYVIGLRVKDRVRAELHAGRVEWMFTFLILFLIVWQFVGPRVV